MHSRKLVSIVLLSMLALVLAACAGAAGEPGPAGPAGPAGLQGPAGAAATADDLSCMECHNDTNTITGKATAWSESLHGTGESYVRGTSAGCAGCHSGGAFSAMVAAGQNPGEVETGDPDPTRQDCRACHAIHTSYTGADWALETTAPVTLYAFEGVTYDGGEGNLCATCHQPRRAFEAAEGIVNWTSSHYGPHHGPQSAMLLGTGGAGEEGSPAAHFAMVEDTCVSCHVGEGANHTFEPDVAACTGCHADAEDFDINGAQTEVEELLAELQEVLVAKGMLTEEDESVVGEYPEAEGAALWNYIFIAHEDKSMGAHNPNYTNALLEASLAAFE